MSDDALREAAKVIVDAHGYGAKAGRPDYVACVSADKIEALRLALVGAAPGRAPAPEPTKAWERPGGSWTSYLTEIGRKEMAEGLVMRAEWFSGAPPAAPAEPPHD